MKPNSRKSDLAKIHIAKKQMGMEDDTYRAMLMHVAGVDSAGKLDMNGRMKVLHHLSTQGFKPKKFKGKPNNVAREPQLKKIEALLADMKLSWAYADAMAKHMFKVEKVAWLKEGKQYQAVITALVKKQAKLNG